jgi:hypothetical protein
MESQHDFYSKNPKVSTHKAYILYKLLRGNRIKNKEMWNQIDTCYSACRISELSSDGWLIDKRPIHQTTLEKKQVTVKEYFMNTLHLSEVLQNQEVQDFLRRYELQQLKKAS